ncbi:hypothetical protein GCM10009836_31150 [Pseudonocardia ailaonensis]|uniref:Uncharacterized protein n=1 Tax=Pseudonocardia ailaonensis TaxID=367279 RepID=A0ABN2N2I8_9PSEU
MAVDVGDQGLVGEVGRAVDRAADWTVWFARSALAPTVFEVRPAGRSAVRRWLAGEHLATAGGRDPHSPVVDAWAVLDGGIVAVARWDRPGTPPPPDVLPAGLYVVGFGAFRLLTAALGVPRPERPLPGEPLYEAAVLARAHEDTCTEDADEVAQLLASCSDSRELRLVAGALAGAPP